MSKKEDREALEKESPFTTQNREEKALVSLDGTAVTKGGKLTKSDYFRFIGYDLDQYDLKMTKEEAHRIHCHISKMSTGSTAMVPLYCGGPKCPFKDRCPLFKIGKYPLGQQCHPPGTLVQTPDGKVAIERLDPKEHKVLTYDIGCGLIKKRGRSFDISLRVYNGDMIQILVDGELSHECTADHICMATWNERAIDLFCVYLMQRGDSFRVGKSKLLNRLASGKLYSALSTRARTEQCDRLWILGVYESNTEALLAEEYFSIEAQAPKACFIDRPCYSKTKKQEGLYKWVTQGQLDTHHESLRRPIFHYAEFLSSIGLSIDFPFWEALDRTRSSYEQIGSIGKLFQIRACNLIGEYMNMALFDEKVYSDSIGKGNSYENRTYRVPITVNRRHYNGSVYSLDVQKEHTYIAGNLVTHNCLIETQLLRDFTIRYFEEFDVDPYNWTEVGYVNELAEIDIYLTRLKMLVARPENAELVIDQVVGISPHGETPIIQKQLSPFMEQMDKLNSRKSKIIKLMVGDRQEKYKKEAALKVKLEEDPSSKQAAIRSKLEKLQRSLDSIPEVPIKKTASPAKAEGVLTPEDIIDAIDDG